MRLNRRSMVRSVLAACGLTALPNLAFGERGKNVLGAARGIHKDAPEPRHRRPRRFDREPRVLLITTAQSAESQAVLQRLQQKSGAFAQLENRGWRIAPTANSHIQLLTAEQRPDLVRRFGITHYPWVGTLQHGQIVRSFSDGCSTPLDVWTFHWLLTGESERPEEPMPAEITVAWTGHYPLRGGHWSILGDDRPIFETVVHHLRSARHARQISLSWDVESWSYEELRSLHDDVHERGRPKPLLKAVTAQS